MANRYSSPQIFPTLTRNHVARRVALGLLFVLLSMGNNSHAALSQLDVNGPGGFISALAGLGNGGGPFAGGDFGTAYGTTVNIDERTFTSSASATSNYNDGTNINSAMGSVSFGAINFAASNSASNAGFAQGIVNGGWNDILTFTNSALTGQDGYFLFDLNVSGTQDVNGFAGLSRFGVTAYVDHIQLRKSAAPGFSAGNSDPISTDRQAAQWQYSSFGANEPLRIVNGTLTFAVPFTYGDSFELGVYANAWAGKRSSSAEPGVSTSSADFTNSLYWGGITGVFANGSPDTGFSLSAASGVNWTAPIPVPPAFILLLSALAALMRNRGKQIARTTI